ncbi:hypothetical protein BB559_005094 [Furculomyces boomerangus]|uniref:Eukaryotic translation initiation factor 3 subunit I n=1 Tax=Furculomyces boomerangus TaxID=61424 RepID=A0A2T9YAT9_9FUNG|nr:hypothetical protein BB559_005094 [Furculomyces boomerangus]
MRPILLQGHTRPLTQIKYNNEGDLLFTVAKDTVVNVWYSHNGERLGTYEGHQGALWSVDVNSKSTLLITGAADNTARLWDVKTGKQLHVWKTNTAVKRVEFSCDNKHILFVTEKRMGFESEIYVFRIDESGTQSDTPVVVIRPKDSKATVAAWSYFDKYIVAGHEDGSVTLYNWRESDPEKQISKTVKVHQDTITDLQTSKDRSYLITSSKDKTAQLIDIETLDLLKLYQSDTSLNTATIIPDRDYVILGGGQAASEVTTTSSHQGKFESRFYHEVFENEIGRVRGHFGPINTVAVSPVGDSFSTGSEDGYVRVHFFDPDYFKYKFDV